MRFLFLVLSCPLCILAFFFFNDTATTEIYTLSLHDALPIYAELASKFASLAKQLADNESKIIEELRTVQGKAVDIGGYYMPDVAKMDAVMRPSATFNAAIDALL